VLTFHDAVFCSLTSLAKILSPRILFIQNCVVLHSSAAEVFRYRRKSENRGSSSDHVVTKHSKNHFKKLFNKRAQLDKEKYYSDIANDASVRLTRHCITSEHC